VRDAVAQLHELSRRTRASSRVERLLLLVESDVCDGADEREPDDNRCNYSGALIHGRWGVTRASLTKG
jgi:hypothetical protein